MFFTKKDSAAVYARACRAWYGARAKTVVDSQINRLEAKGDLKGVDMWRLVAEALSQLEPR
jgi:hypothetical protein